MLVLHICYYERVLEYMSVIKVFIVAVLAIVVACTWYGVTVSRRLEDAKNLISQAWAFELISGDYAVSMLVLGDSTAVGVGASKPEDSVPGRVAQKINATYVENHAQVGAQVKDLESQIAAAKLREYTLILIQIGANDIIRFRSADTAAQKLQLALEKLPKANKVILISAGNVGGVQAFPFFVRPIHTHLTLKYHAAFDAVMKEYGGTYVNLYEDPKSDKVLLEPETYVAADGLHLSSEGYRLWFEKIETSLE